MTLYGKSFPIHNQIKNLFCQITIFHQHILFRYSRVTPYFVLPDGLPVAFHISPAKARNKFFEDKETQIDTLTMHTQLYSENTKQSFAFKLNFSLQVDGWEHQTKFGVQTHWQLQASGWNVS
jgi:hypothetical protein